MLKHVYLKNFKCFDELALPLGGLTLITGVNGAGKSTLLKIMAGPSCVGRMTVPPAPTWR